MYWVWVNLVLDEEYICSSNDVSFVGTLMTCEIWENEGFLRRLLISKF
jgi:hypothetical protein